MGDLKLHLGCGRGRLEGWVNCDLHPGPTVDYAFDVQEKWPFQDDSAAEIYASHMLEHLSDPFAFFREAHRVLRPNGTFLLRTPHGASASAWCDLTHQRPWYAGTYGFLQPGYAEEVRNPQSDAWQHFFGLHVIDEKVHAKFAPIMRWKLLRKPMIAVGNHLLNFYDELWAYGYALKTPEAVAEYQRLHTANVVPVRRVMFRHVYEGRPLRPGEAPEFIDFAEDTETTETPWFWQRRP